MKFCPMCGMPQSKAGRTVCEFCDYEEKPIDALGEQEIYDLMAPYEYERIEGGVRIVAVKNVRNIALRGAVSIPHFVTEIAADAFSHCKFLARIDLPKGLRSIGDGAFARCRDLFDVFIPASVGYIGKGAFSYLSLRVSAISEKALFPIAMIFVSSAVPRPHNRTVGIASGSRIAPRRWSGRASMRCDPPRRI